MAERITILSAADESAALRRAAAMLRKGRVGIIPTDTVYGIAALACDPLAVDKVITVKRRPAGKPLPVQIADLDQAEALALMNDSAREIAMEFWPGPLTMVLSRRPGFDLPHQPPDTIGLRMPDSSFCLGLIRTAGYLVVPSANPEGTGPPARPEEIDAGLLAEVDFLVDAGECPGGVESTVVDLRGAPILLREGAIGGERLLGGREGLPEG